LTHSSHWAKDTNAAIAMTPITRPAIMAPTLAGQPESRRAMG
jgi:hypothetical protein